jgi:hypothetical protein
VTNISRYNAVSYKQYRKTSQIQPRKACRSARTTSKVKCDWVKKYAHGSCKALGNPSSESRMREGNARGTQTLLGECGPCKVLYIDISSSRFEYARLLMKGVCIAVKMG